MPPRETGGMGPEIIGGKGGFQLPPLPKRLTGIIAIVAILLLLTFGILNTCFEYVRPNEFGIKEAKVGPNRGIQEKVYPPGLAFVLPFGLERIHHFPRNIQVLELTDFPTRQTTRDRFRPTFFSDKAAKIQTSDGFYVDVDVTILYRIVDPYKLINSVGPGLLYHDNGILPKAEPILKQAFGELATEDFYNSPLRVEKAEMARDLLDAELAPKGFKIDHVLVRYFRYSDEIQRNIELKKLQDQLVFKNQAEGRAAKEEASLKRVTQEGEMQVRITLEGGNAYKVKKDAERELYVRKKKAQADLLVQLAEAKRTELKNTAMQVVGADKMVALRMADVLKGLDCIIVPAGGETGLNPLDLDQLLTLFGVPMADAKAAPQGPSKLATELLSSIPVPPPLPPPPPPPALPPPAEPALESPAEVIAPNLTPAQPAAPQPGEEVAQ
ncbi:MAG: SPFH domain-containing protein [Nitrospiraceae bacterium]|nr:SPFH domain-containing protein [Nitrospiraceae bacterium]